MGGFSSFIHALAAANFVVFRHRRRGGEKEREATGWCGGGVPS
jgi:hypothetical protein